MKKWDDDIMIAILSEYKNKDDIHISFTKYPEIKINKNRENNSYATLMETPNGIYTYPLKLIWKKIESKKINKLFAADWSKYCLILKENTNNIVYTAKYNNSNLEKDKEKIYKLFLTDIKGFQNYSFSNSRNEETFKIYFNHCLGGWKNEKPPFKLLKIASITIFDDSSILPKELKEYNQLTWIYHEFYKYDAIIDTKNVLSTDRDLKIQAVFFDEKYLKLIKVIDKD